MKSKTHMTTSLIISTYNWKEALELVLKSVLRQTIMPLEIVIADDGSKADTKALIDDFKTRFDIPLHHVWQEDQGFRKSMIINKAVAKAAGDYIIQVDGDCIMHPAFIKDHLRYAKPGVYLSGSRVSIKESYLKSVFEKQKIRYHFFSKGLKKRGRALHLPWLSRFYKESDGFNLKNRGCNMSFTKADFIAVNGYNEDFEGWGREDSELGRRFHNYGLLNRRLKNIAIIYHIYHYEKPKDKLEENHQMEVNAVTNKTVWCEHGIDKYLSDKN
ncbi:glycosyltransferase family 2 protein [Psychroserpens sp. SPM9]|uniref:glycosyltransferase family 2 protein n=1 Tax=Psychroserpens sp. SPM9 TaxID=2975598 RepID=UPI0021A44044|nr:glycosyltransferase family 2 protein [Psychroserpens sp. SPM9]MDG5492365.1 glycosyltransferase family 2 protein [Psychroserpens sp. SPM9]